MCHPANRPALAQAFERLPLFEHLPDCRAKTDEIGTEPDSALCSKGRALALLRIATQANGHD